MAIPRPALSISRTSTALPGLRKFASTATRLSPGRHSRSASRRLPASSGT